MRKHTLKKPGLKNSLVLFIFIALAYAVAPRQDFVSDVSKVALKRGLRMVQNSSWEIGWRFTNTFKNTAVDLTSVSNNANGSVLFTYVPPNQSFFKTVTGRVENGAAGQVVIPFAPSDLATNGTFNWRLAASDGTTVLAYAYGELQLVKDVTSGVTNQFNPSQGVIHWSFYSFTNTSTHGPYRAGTNIIFSSNADGSVGVNLVDSGQIQSNEFLQAQITTNRTAITAQGETNDAQWLAISGSNDFLRIDGANSMEADFHTGSNDIVMGSGTIVYSAGGSGIMVTNARGDTVIQGRTFINDLLLYLRHVNPYFWIDDIDYVATKGHRIREIDGKMIISAVEANGTTLADQAIFDWDTEADAHIRLADVHIHHDPDATNSFTNGYFSVRSSSSGRYGDIFMVWSNGNVGIGFPTPTNKLSVRGRVDAHDPVGAQDLVTLSYMLGSNVVLQQQVSANTASNLLDLARLDLLEAGTNANRGLIDANLQSNLNDRASIDIIEGGTNDYLRTDGNNKMLANVNAGGFRGTNAADPVFDTDWATKKYVDDQLPADFELWLVSDSTLTNEVLDLASTTTSIVVSSATNNQHVWFWAATGVVDIIEASEFRVHLHAETSKDSGVGLQVELYYTNAADGLVEIAEGDVTLFTDKNIEEVFDMHILNVAATNITSDTMFGIAIIIHEAVSPNPTITLFMEGLEKSKVEIPISAQTAIWLPRNGSLPQTGDTSWGSNDLSYVNITNALAFHLGTGVMTTNISNSSTVSNTDLMVCSAIQDAIAAGGGARATTYSNLTDTSVVDPQIGDLTRWDGTNWVNTSGYWDRGNPSAADYTNFIIDNAWHTLSLATNRLGSNVVPVGVKSVILRLQVIDDTVAQIFSVKKNGLSNNFAIQGVTVKTASIFHGPCMVVAVDADRKIEYRLTTGLANATRTWLIITGGYY